MFAANAVNNKPWVAGGVLTPYLLLSAPGFHCHGPAAGPYHPAVCAVPFVAPPYFRWIHGIFRLLLQLIIPHV